MPQRLLCHKMVAQAQNPETVSPRPYNLVMAMRRVPMRGGSTPAKPKYLFAERGSPYEITLMLAERLKKELVAIPQEVLRDSSVEALTDEIVQRYTLNVPVLDRRNIREFEPVEVRLQVPQNSQYGMFGGPGPHYADATALKISVPFTGDKNLFKYATTMYGNPIEGEVIDDAVVLTHIAKDPVPEAVNKEFEDRLNRIETALQFSRESVSDWNNGLMNKVKPAVEKRMATVQRNQSITLGYQKAAPVDTPASPIRNPAYSKATKAESRFDVFLSHASEDKDEIARPLHDALTAEGVSVWFDEAVLKMGDSLSGKIDEGLARCGHGIVIISPSFLAKRWPKHELAGLVAREMAGGKTVILPIWHNIDHATLLAHSPTLADKVAGNTTDGIPALVRMILAVIR